MKETMPPETVEQAVNHLVGGLTEEERRVVAEADPAEFHFGAGTQMRNTLRLWGEDSPIRADAIKNYSIAHADDISGLIMAWAFAIVRGGPRTFDPMKHCKRYWDHWGGKEEALKAGGAHR